VYLDAPALQARGGLAVKLTLEMNANSFVHILQHLERIAQDVREVILPGVLGPHQALEKQSAADENGCRRGRGQNTADIGQDSQRVIQEGEKEESCDRPVISRGQGQTFWWACTCTGTHL